MKVGIVGAGQLGRMLGLAAIPLNIECVFLDRSGAAPAAAVGRVLKGALDDEKALCTLARETDMVTAEIENISVEALEAASAICPVHPAPAAIAAAQDRLAEKQLFASLDVPTAAYVVVDKDADLDHVATLGTWPVLLKSRRLGYDGRGQRVARSTAELGPAWHGLGRVPAIAEARISFEREVSLIGARNGNGEIVFYPLCENVHVRGILATTIAPYLDQDLQARAETCMRSIMEHFDYRGCLTIEFFVTATGLVANEIAPRVHNSGHWTIEGAETSQFENHLRAIANLPIGDPAPRGHAAMVNLIGALPPRAELLGLRGVHLHDYGKSPRPGRKLGHCTIVDADRQRLFSRLGPLKSLANGRNP